MLISLAFAKPCLRLCWPRGKKKQKLDKHICLKSKPLQGHPPCLWSRESILKLSKLFKLNKTKGAD
uniref:Uncharacterized protein n=1 Tax=Phlebia radiata TaxID=5308 RepID=L8B9C7_PHLRA|nr:hypothetical protein PRA_mt0073 [Phlebia radiata]YP_007374969.1 hypothetical protein PRA_mt0185 [Phlebia radiata]CCE89190.1 hypothetical protein PRA_mt0073 [Phlebia radiata]CCE89248.1 hypothetical protein PRA_mt0185 [Phlebia radiata]